MAPEAAAAETAVRKLEPEPEESKPEPEPGPGQEPELVSRRHQPDL